MGDRIKEPIALPVRERYTPREGSVTGTVSIRFFARSAWTRDGARVDEVGADRTTRRMAPRLARSSWAAQTGEVTRRQFPSSVSIPSQNQASRAS
jgi:hypothetical protein